MVTLAPLRAALARPLAEVHVRCWQQTYRGLLPDEVLDDPRMLQRRTEVWQRLCTDPDPAHRHIVAEVSSNPVGFAMAGPVRREDAGDDPGVDVELWSLYLLAQHHGTGIGQQLFDAVIRPEESAVLWVARDNARARRFYARNGFSPDGTVQAYHGMAEVRLVRRPDGSTAGRR